MKVKHFFFFFRKGKLNILDIDQLVFARNPKISNGVGGF